MTTTSLAGEMGLVLDGIYAADKWAVTGVCEMLYHELYPFGIQVKTIVPGVVKIGFKMEMSEMLSQKRCTLNGRNWAMKGSANICEVC